MLSVSGVVSIPFCPGDQHRLVGVQYLVEEDDDAGLGAGAEDQLLLGARCPEPDMFVCKVLLDLLNVPNGPVRPF